MYKMIKGLELIGFLYSVLLDVAGDKAPLSNVVDTPLKIWAPISQTTRLEQRTDTFLSCALKWILKESFNIWGNIKNIFFPARFKIRQKINKS